MNTELSKKDFDRVLALVKRIAFPPIDVENLAAEILYESWTKGYRPSRGFILNRCFDEIRKVTRAVGQDARRSYKVFKEQESGIVEGVGESKERVEILSDTIKRALLSHEEIRIMHLRYWQDCSFEDIAFYMKLKLYKVVELHNTLMSKLRLHVNKIEN